MNSLDDCQINKQTNKQTTESNDSEEVLFTGRFLQNGKEWNEFNPQMTAGGDTEKH